MPRLWNIIRQKPVRASAQTSLQASAALPTSGATSIDNSEGASQAIAELLDSLDIALAQISIEDDLKAQFTTQLEQLERKASSYVNSSLDSCSSKEPWTCTAEMANLITKAWICAETVYERDVAVSTEQMKDADLKIEWSLASSANGNVKATTLTTFVAPPPYGSRAEPTTYLIIAVRGSASTVDHLVNLNGEARDASTLFQNMEQAPGFGHEPLKFLAHAGFLNSTRELLAPISAQIEKQLDKSRKFNILLTGHSAGGAVATLLHLALRAKFAGVSFSCITFGSPPVARFVNKEDRDALDQAMAKAPVLNIINEYDLVPRLDAGYLRSLIRLYNSRNLNSNSEDTLTAEGTSGERWLLPAPDLQHIGPIVVLKTELPDLKLDSIKPPKVTTKVTAWSISSESLSDLVFCQLGVHRRKYYQQKIEQLADYNDDSVLGRGFKT
ncbi:Alpha/Beta hydrolase protein [Xylaria flabelliformis]|nr:Alpha/Beta hydrolase protein [Xylaria flabelliformis]